MQRGFVPALAVIGVFCGMIVLGFLATSFSKNNQNPPVDAPQVTISPNPTGAQTIGVFNPENNPEETKCIAEKESSYSGEFAKGEVILGFKENVSQIEKDDILAKYRLSKKSDVGPIAILVGVPVGKEYSFICRLETESVVKYAEVNGISRALESNGPQ